MRVNPVYKKELRIRVRTVKLSLIILGYNALLAIIGLFAFYMSFQMRGYNTISYSNIVNIYSAIAILEFALVIFIVPAFTAGSISGERERQTLEIMLTSKLNPIQIILGKLASSISTILLLVFSSLPILAIVFSVGGIRFRDLLQLMFLTFVTAVFVGSIGVFFSTLFKRTVPATVLTYGSVIALILGTVAITSAVFMVATWNIQKQNFGDAKIPTADLGNFLMIFLINPAVTMGSMLTKQYGSGNVLDSFLREYGNCNQFVADNWFVISVLVQLIISAILILSAARILDPLKKHSKKQSKKKLE